MDNGSFSALFDGFLISLRFHPVLDRDGDALSFRVIVDEETVGRFHGAVRGRFDNTAGFPVDDEWRCGETLDRILCCDVRIARGLRSGDVFGCGLGGGLIDVGAVDREVAAADGAAAIRIQPRPPLRLPWWMSTVCFSFMKSQQMRSVTTCYKRYCHDIRSNDAHIKKLNKLHFPDIQHGTTSHEMSTSPKFNSYFYVQIRVTMC